MNIRKIASERTHAPVVTRTRKAQAGSQKTTVKPKATEAPRRPAVDAPKPYHHGNLRETLLAAADSVLAQNGASGITLRDVAKAAGVSHAAPYHHFASLDDLLATVAERGFQRLSEALSATALVTDSGERLMRISEVYVSCARAHPSQFRLMFGPLLARKREFPALQAAAKHAFNMVLEAANAHDPARGFELALLGWSLTHGLSNLLIDGALDGMAEEVPSANTLARQLTARAINDSRARKRRS